MNWLPEHKCGLYLTHNQHRDVYETVQEFYEPEDFVSEEEWTKAVFVESYGRKGASASNCAAAIRARNIQNYSEKDNL